MTKTKKVFDKNLFGILANSAMHKIILIFMDTFLVAYLLNISAGNFFNVSFYYLLSYIAIIISYTLFSYIVCKLDKVKVVRAAIVLICLTLISIAILQSKISDFVIPIAIIYGTSKALYWSALNSLSNETIKGKKIQSYNTSNIIIQNITSIVVPIVFGSIIDSSSLQVISIFVSIVGVIQIFMTFMFDKPKIIHKKLNFKEYFNECYKYSNKKCFNLLYAGFIVKGCEEGITTLVTMLIVLSFKTNTSLGAISSLISILAIVLLLIFKKPNKNNHLILSSTAFITIISMILLIFNISRPYIIFFNICYGGLLTLNNRAFSVKRSGMIRAIDKKEYIVEHQATIETFLNLGRIIFYSLLLIASFSTNISIYKILLVLSIIIVLLYGIFSYLLEKEYNKILIQREFKKQHSKSDDEIELMIPSYSNQNNGTILK